jgi:predicted AlkP superfamily phosphohydrolase/phosphomutase
VRLLVVGIDGGTWEVLGPRLIAGAMPATAELLAGSIYGETDTTWPAHTGPGWPTLVTGASPGVHGVFNFFESQTTDYGMSVVSASRWADRSLLNRLARRGHVVASMNVPMSHPPSGELRVELTWPLTETTRFSAPRSVAHDLIVAQVPYALDLHTMYRGQANYLELAEANVRARVSTGRHLCREHPELEVFVVVLTEFDRVAHHLWDNDPFGMPGGEPVTRICHALDEAIADLVEASGNCDLLLVSDHGFGSAGPSLSLNTYLEDGGWLRTTNAHHGVSDAPWFTGDRGSVDWNGTVAYAPTPGGWGVNINLGGRQQCGVVRPRDAEAMLPDLCAALAALRAPDGRPALRAVLRTRELYPGPRAGLGPDLMLIPIDERFGMNCDLSTETWVENTQRANHRFAGMWALRSAAFDPGEVEPIALTSVLPTALEAAGLTDRLDWELRASPVADVLRPRPASSGREAARGSADEAERPTGKLFDALKRMGYA